MPIVCVGWNVWIVVLLLNVELVCAPQAAHGVLHNIKPPSFGIIHCNNRTATAIACLFVIRERQRDRVVWNTIGLPEVSIFSRIAFVAIDSMSSAVRIIALCNQQRVRVQSRHWSCNRSSATPSFAS